MKRIRRHRLVEEDLKSIASYIARDSVESALRFYDNFDKTLIGLSAMPGKGSLHHFADPELREVRSWAVEGFPNHLVFYRITPRHLDVMAVLHGARDLEPELKQRAGEK